MKKGNNYLRGVICTLIGGICWGFSGACGQILVQSASLRAEWVTTIRMFFAGVILSLINIITQKSKAFDVFKSRKTAIRLVMFAIFGLIVSQVTYLKAISYSNAGTATVLQYIGPVLIMLWVCLTKRRLPELREAVAVVLAVAGVVILATHGDLTTLKLSKECLFWGIGAAVGLVLYSLLPGDLIEGYGAISITGFGMLIGGIVMMIAIRPWSAAVELNMTAILALMGMVIVGTVFAYTMYLQGVGDIGSVKASMIACIEPVSAALFARFWLKSSIVGIDWIGFAMILSTVFILSIKKNERN